MKQKEIMAWMEPYDIQFFSSPEEFNAWLEENHNTADELWVGFYKVHTKKPSLTWSQSVDEALCYGWIDGIKKTLDKDSYTQRFTPRRKGSAWSNINIEKMKKLQQEGKMRPAGLKAFKRKEDRKSGIYAFEQKEAELSDSQLRLFKQNRKAWDFFRSQPPGYRRLAIYWVISAKQEATRERRLNTLIEDSEYGLRIKHLRRN